MKHNDTAYNIYVAFVIAQALTFPHIQPWLKIGLPKNHVMGMECACECVFTYNWAFFQWEQKLSTFNVKIVTDYAIYAKTSQNCMPLSLYIAKDAIL